MIPGNRPYRPDIDGLRAVAVLSVALFHANFALFQGGFVGVDVFFVISGYLITGLIREQAQAGTFSFTQFYVRRARRLLPALLFTYLLCAAAAWVLFIPEHLERFGMELISSVFSVSNFYFWQEADYFDVEAVFKPLLHTWSLSVEEQFYLLWPALLVWILGRKLARLPVAFLLGMGAASLILNQLFIHHPVLIFYLIPFRLFEFCIGALLLWLPHRPRVAWISDVLVLAGLGMIACAVFTFSKATPFPSLPALLPCLGAALVIHTGAQARLSRWLLANPIMVGIGLVSYSFYLTHWPALVFYKYYRFDPIGNKEALLVLAGAFALAVCMYFLIERPGRKSAYMLALAPKALAFRAVTAALVFTLAGGYFWASNGAPQRTVRTALSAEFMQALRKTNCIDGYGMCNPFDRTVRYFMIGDSHINAMKTLLGIIAAESRENLDAHMTLACRALYASGLDCAGEVDKKFRELAEGPIPNIILVSSWNTFSHTQKPEFILEKLASTIDYLQTAGKKVYVYGSIPVMDRSPSTCFQRPDPENCEEFMVPTDYPAQKRFNAALKEVAQSRGAGYLDFFARLCDEERCRVAYEGQSLYASDRFHFNARNISAYMMLTHRKDRNVSFDAFFPKDE